MEYKIKLIRLIGKKLLNVTPEYILILIRDYGLIFRCRPLLVDGGLAKISRELNIRPNGGWVVYIRKPEPEHPYPNETPRDRCVTMIHEIFHCAFDDSGYFTEPSKETCRPEKEIRALESGVTKASEHFVNRYPLFCQFLYDQLVQEGDVD